MEAAHKLLRDGLTALDIEPTGRLIGYFETYLRELKRWNQTYNLTALKNDRDIVIKHFLDSLLYLRFLPSGKHSIADVGSGAGFPGIPLALVRNELSVSLIEPTRKKVAFLKNSKRELSLENVEVIGARVEEVEGRNFDVVVTRALFSVKDFIEKAGHLVKENGFCLVSKGPRVEEELKDLPPSVRYEVVKVLLPLTDLNRSLIKISVSRT